MSAIFRAAILLAAVICVLGARPAEAQYTIYGAGNQGFVTGINGVTPFGTMDYCQVPTQWAVRPDGQAAYYAASDFHPLPWQAKSHAWAFHASYFVTYPLTGGGCDAVKGIPVDGAIGLVSYAADGRRLYAVDASHFIHVLDPATGAVVGRGFTGLPTSEPDPLIEDGFQPVTPAGLAVSPDGKVIVIPSTARKMVIIDATTLKMIALVDTHAPTPPVWSGSTTTIALKWTAEPSTRRIYLTHTSGVDVYSGATYEFLTTIPGRGGALAVSHDGSRLYIAASGLLHIVDTQTNAVLQSVQGGYASIAVSPDGRYVYTSGGFAGFSVSVFDTFTNVMKGMTRPPFTPEFKGGNTMAIARLPFASLDLTGTVPGSPGAPFTLSGTIGLGSGHNGIDPVHETVTLAIGANVLWMPPGFFQPSGSSTFRFQGTLDTNTGPVTVDAELEDLGGGQVRFQFSGDGAVIAGSLLPFQAMLILGDDGGTGTIDLDAPFHKTIAGLQSDLASAQATVSALGAQNDALVQANADLDQQNSALAGQVAGLLAQIQSLNEQLQALTSTNQALAAENTTLRDANITLQSQLSQALQELEALGAAIDRLPPGLRKLVADALAGGKGKK